MYSMRLAPGRDRIKGHFLENVIVKSLPGSIAVVLAVLAVNLWGYLSLGLDYGQVSTLCVLLTAWIGMWATRSRKPSIGRFTWWKTW